MKTMPGTLTLTSIGLTLGLGLAAAGSGPASGAPSGGLGAIAARLTARTGTPVLTDPLITLETPLRAPHQTTAPEQALKLLSASVPDTAWCRVYLPSDKRAPHPDADTLAATVRALS